MPEMRLGPVIREQLGEALIWRNQFRDSFRQFQFLNALNQEDWFERVSRDNENFMYSFLVDATFIGVCGLTHTNWKDRTSEVSIYIGHPEYRGMGLGKVALRLLIREAFMVFGLHRLTAEIYSFNEGSIHLFEGAGFVREGLLRKAAWVQGQWYDSIIYGLLAEEVSFEASPTVWYERMDPDSIPSSTAAS
jgi:RimJ/RimL family protein N-acetyltransferase